MLSAFCCVTCHQPGTTCRVPSFIPLNFLKQRILWNRPSGVRVSNLCGPRTVRRLRPQSCRMASVVSLSFRFGAATTTCTCHAPFLMINKKLGVNAYSYKQKSRDPVRSAHTLPWERLAAFTLSVTIALGGQPAYADFKPALQADLYQLEKMISSSSDSDNSVSSVEAILAKQLARRFREMSDEELVDILQQLLKASRSSLESRVATPQQSQQPGKKNVDKVHAGARDPEIPETAKNFGNSVTQESSQSEEQPGKDQANRGTDTSPQGDRSSSQVGRKTTDSTSKKAEDIRKQGQAILQDKTNNEIIAGSESSQTQGYGTSSSILRKAERKADASGGSDLSVPDVTRVTEAPKTFDKVLNQDGENVSQPENATELLLAEWSRRVTAKSGQEFQSSNFNLTEIWRDVQIYCEIVGNKVVLLTGSVFEMYKDVVGVVFVCLISLVSAFYIGRSRSTSTNKLLSDRETSSTVQGGQPERSESGVGFGRGHSKLGSKLSSPDSTFSSLPSGTSIPGTEKGIPEDQRGIDGRMRKENYGSSPSVIDKEEVMTAHSDQPESLTWWRKTSKESSLSNEEIPGEILPRAADRSRYDSNRSGEGRRPDWSNTASTPSGTFGIREFGTLEREGSIADSTSISGKAERGQQVNTDASLRPTDSFYSPKVPMTSPERSFKESRQGSLVLPGRNRSVDKETAQDYSGHGERVASPARVDVHEEKFRDLQSESMNLRMDRKSREGQVLPEEEQITSPSGLKHRGRGVISITQPEEGAEGRNRDGLSTMSHHKQRSPDAWRRVVSSRTTKISRDSSNQVAITDKTNGFTSVRSPESKNVVNRARKLQNSTPLEDCRDSFVHRGVLWVRDSDGVFVRHGSDQEEMTSTKVHDKWRTLSRESEGSLEMIKQEHEIANRSKRKGGLPNGFDYRHLVISSNGKLTGRSAKEVNTMGGEWQRPEEGQMRPLRFGSDRREGSEQVKQNSANSSADSSADSKTRGVVHDVRG